jgi:rod shape-determining protein MreD
MPVPVNRLSAAYSFWSTRFRVRAAFVRILTSPYTPRVDGTSWSHSNSRSVAYSPPRGLTAMSPAFAAVGAGIAALLESTIVSRYQIAGAQLQIVLILGIAITLVYGFEEGLVWAFVGGLFLDLLAMRPLGSTVFELLIVMALTDLAVPLLSRSRYPGAVGAALLLTPAFLLISNVVTGLLRPPAPSIHLTSLAAAALANAAVAALAAPLVIGLKRRAEQRERIVWWR